MRSHESLEDKIHFLLSNYIQKKLQNFGLITITSVKLTSDRSIAKIYFTVLGNEKQIKIANEALIKFSKPLRTHLAKTISIHRIPMLKFIIDTTLEKSNNLEIIFQKIKEENIMRIKQQNI